MRFQFISVPDWPQLAWLARCKPADSILTVFHGSRVEIADEWFCEAAWTGKYDSGDFDQTDIVAGSGCRLREGKAIFVSSGSTVDRLNCLEHKDGVWVSNSLSCLLAAAAARVDPSYPKYFRLLRTMVKGIRDYNRFLPTSVGSAHLIYFDNLVWDGKRLTVKAKPGKGRDFSSFSRYYGFLQSSMQTLAENMADSGRKYPYELLSTASSGYDSSAVTTLAKQAGCRQVMCVDHARHQVEDSGEALTSFLGLTPVKVKRDAWASMSALPEVPFIAADSHGGDVFFKGAEPLLAGKVLLTGFHGDKMWDKQTKHLCENIVRGDQSGLSLSDYRLMAGFLHCPVPFWGVRQIRDVYAISHSAEMKPWDVPGDYSRPICRRIVEEAGVPREMFGIEKLASWVKLNRQKAFLSDQSMQDYIDWLGENRMEWVRQGRVPPVRSLSLDVLELSWRSRFKYWAAKKRGLSQLALHYSGLRLFANILYDRPTRLRRYVFPWALEHLKKVYGQPF
jgi:hypothetical protein